MSGSVWVHAADLWQHLYACRLHRLKAASLREAAEAAFTVQERLDHMMVVMKTEQKQNCQGEINKTSIFFTWVQMFNSVGGH